MRIFKALAICWPLFAFGLDYHETLRPVRLLEAYPGNILVFNRGPEDGITKGEHVKLLSIDGYIGRLICLKSEGNLSYWKIYRIIDQSLITKDITYSLVGINSLEPEENIKQMRHQFPNKIPEYKNKTKDDAPEAANAKKEAKEASDLPESTEGLETLDEGPKEYVYFNKRELKRDLHRWNGRFSVAPWMTQQGPVKSNNMAVSGMVHNIGRKYDWKSFLEHQRSSTALVTTGEEVKTSRSLVTSDFFIHRENSGLSTQSSFFWRRWEIGEVLAPGQQYLVAPIGFRYSFKSLWNLKFLNLSYLPTYDWRSDKIISLDENSVKNSTSIRHAINLEFSGEFNQNSFYQFKGSWRPKMDFATWNIDTDNSLMQADFLVGHNLYKKLSVNYNFQWFDDAELRRSHNISRSTIMNSMNLTYDFEI